MLQNLKQKLKNAFGVQQKPDREQLEKLANLYYLVIARTGVVTRGPVRLVSVIPSPMMPIKEDLLLQITASVEQQAEHPLAAAISQEADARGLSLSSPRSFAYLQGMGIEAYLADKKIHVGNRSLMDEKLVQIDVLPEQIEKQLQIFLSQLQHYSSFFQN